MSAYEPVQSGQGGAYAHNYYRRQVMTPLHHSVVDKELIIFDDRGGIIYIVNLNDVVPQYLATIFGGGANVAININVRG
jgi:hypothetical protein